MSYIHKQISLSHILLVLSLLLFCLSLFLETGNGVGYSHMFYVVLVQFFLFDPVTLIEFPLLLSVYANISFLIVLLLKNTANKFYFALGGALLSLLPLYFNTYPHMSTGYVTQVMYDQQGYYVWMLSMLVLLIYIVVMHTTADTKHRIRPAVLGAMVALGSIVGGLIFLTYPRVYEHQQNQISVDTLVNALDGLSETISTDTPDFTPEMLVDARYITIPNPYIIGEYTKKNLVLKDGEKTYGVDTDYTRHTQELYGLLVEKGQFYVVSLFYDEGQWSLRDYYSGRISGD